MNLMNHLLSNCLTNIKKGGLMNSIKSFLSESRKSFFSTTVVCFFETLWTIGCSVVAGAIPALAKSQYKEDSIWNLIWGMFTANVILHTFRNLRIFTVKLYNDKDWLDGDWWEREEVGSNLLQQIKHWTNPRRLPLPEAESSLLKTQGAMSRNILLSLLHCYSQLMLTDMQFLCKRGNEL